MFINKPIKLTSLDFPFNEDNIFKIPINTINKNLESSFNLNSFLVDNNGLLFKYNNNGDILLYLNKVVIDCKLYLDIQLNLLTLINNPTSFEQHINSIKHLVKSSNLFYIEDNKSELHNIKFNKNLFNILNDLFIEHKDVFKNNKSFSISKLKEFYVLNDLDYLNAKNNKILFIDIFNNVNQFRNEYNNFICLISQDSEIRNSRIFYKLNSLFDLFIRDFNKFNSTYKTSTLDNINFKYYNNAKFKDINKLRKTRMIEYYATLFNVK